MKKRNRPPAAAAIHSAYFVSSYCYYCADTRAYNIIPYTLRMMADIYIIELSCMVYLNEWTCTGWKSRTFARSLKHNSARSDMSFCEFWRRSITIITRLYTDFTSPADTHFTVYVPRFGRRSVAAPRVCYRSSRGPYAILFRVYYTRRVTLRGQDYR